MTSDRERQRYERERHERHRRDRDRGSSSSASSQAVIERLGHTPRGQSHGVAMPLAEATRLLSNSWDSESVRQADMFIDSLAVTSSAAATASVPGVSRQNSSPAAVTATPAVTAAATPGASSEYYNPAMPTDDSTDSSDSNTQNNTQ